MTPMSSSKAKGGHCIQPCTDEAPDKCASMLPELPQVRVIAMRNAKYGESEGYRASLVPSTHEQRRRGVQQRMQETWAAVGAKFAHQWLRCACQTPGETSPHGSRYHGPPLFLTAPVPVCRESCFPAVSALSARCTMLDKKALATKNLLHVSSWRSLGKVYTNGSLRLKAVSPVLCNPSVCAMLKTTSFEQERRQTLSAKGVAVLAKPRVAAARARRSELEQRWPSEYARTPVSFPSRKRRSNL